MNLDYCGPWSPTLITTITSAIQALHIRQEAHEATDE